MGNQTKLHQLMKEFNITRTEAKLMLRIERDDRVKREIKEINASRNCRIIQPPSKEEENDYKGKYGERWEEFYNIDQEYKKVFDEWLSYDIAKETGFMIPEPDDRDFRERYKKLDAERKAVIEETKKVAMEKRLEE